MLNSKFDSVHLKILSEKKLRVKQWFSKAESCGIGSRTRDNKKVLRYSNQLLSLTASTLRLEVAGTYLFFYEENHIGPAKGFMRLLINFYQTLFSNNSTSFWPNLVKSNYTQVTMQGILNKINDIKFSAGSILWPWCWL